MALRLAAGRTKERLLLLRLLNILVHLVPGQ